MSTLQIEDLTPGTGPEATRGRTVDVPCTVRNVAARDDGSWRIGVEFDEVLVPSVAAAITRHCMIEPMRRHLDAAPTDSTAALDTHERVEPVRVGRQPDQPGSRLAIRTLAVAVAGAMASAVPIRAAASSSDRPPAVHVVSTSHP